MVRHLGRCVAQAHPTGDFNSLGKSDCVSSQRGSSQVQGNTASLEFRVFSSASKPVATQAFAVGLCPTCWKKSLAKRVDGVTNNREANV